MASALHLQLDHRPDHVDEALQATMATESIRAYEATPYIGSLFWYSDQDLGTSPTSTKNFFGLRRFDGTHKPAYDALRKAITAG